MTAHGTRRRYTIEKKNRIDRQFVDAKRARETRGTNHVSIAPLRCIECVRMAEPKSVLAAVAGHSSARKSPRYNTRIANRRCTKFSPIDDDRDLYEAKQPF